MLDLDLQEGSIEDGFAFIKGVFFEDCVCGMAALGTRHIAVIYSGKGQLWALGSQQ